MTELSKVLTPENVADTLPRFFGLSRREAEALAVTVKPTPVVPRRHVVTAVRAPAAPFAQPEPRAATAAPEVTLELHPCEVAPARDIAPLQLQPPGPAQRDAVEPLDAERSRLHVTVSRHFIEKLDAAKDALSHAKPGASMEQILEAGLDLVLARQAKRNGLVANARNVVRSSGSNHVPAGVKHPSC